MRRPCGPAKGHFPAFDQLEPPFPGPAPALVNAAIPCRGPETGCADCPAIRQDLDVGEQRTIAALAVRPAGPKVGSGPAIDARQEIPSAELVLAITGALAPQQNGRPSQGIALRGPIRLEWFATWYGGEVPARNAAVGGLTESRPFDGLDIGWCGMQIVIQHAIRFPDQSARRIRQFLLVVHVSERCLKTRRLTRRFCFSPMLIVILSVRERSA